ncbi:phosphotransferase [Ruminococcus sp.]|uniref:phosphotransferase n=1 Tax=Ruminococcus sp. TaxID=41978 RepID=UPI0025D64A48|nr:phosphotransferase [Ruminococcus sp.]MBQ8966922.1 phosphotransferase [Ruminococcus sp.]
MRTTSENGTLTIFLEGRIDTNNAAQTEADIFAARADKAENTIVDAAELEYISSAGLRVLMKLRKAVGRPLPVINVSSEVYEIFETTGFTELLDVQKKLREISVEGCEVVGKGGNGTVYRLDDDKIVKVYRSQSLDAVKREQAFARTALINGVPSVIPYDTVRCGEYYGVVFEMLRSDTLGHAISGDPEHMDEYVERYVALAKELHSTHIPKGAIPDVRDLLRHRIDNLDRWCSEEERSVLRGIVDAMPECDTLLHNDLHPGNIMLQDGELLLIDMAEVTVGPRAFDLAAIYRDMIAGARTDQATTEASQGMPVDMVEQVGKLFFAKYTGMTDPDELKAYFDKMGLLFAFNTVLVCGSDMTSAHAYAPQIMEKLLRPVVLPNKDAIVYLLKTL